MEEIITQVTTVTTTVMEYKAPDNIYWLFSSSAQAIAAFIGFLAAGFFFSYDRIEKQIEKDETLVEIYEDIKSQYYNILCTLFILTGSSIVLSLLMVYLNGFYLGIYGGILEIITGALNVFTIAWAIYFIITIIDPKKVQKTADKLINRRKDIFYSEIGKPLSLAEFMDKFIELEKLLRSIAQKHHILSDSSGRFGQFLSLNEIIRELYRRELISRQMQENLNYVNRIRNLAVHGQIQNIEEKIGSIVENLIKELKEKPISSRRKTKKADSEDNIHK